MGDRSDPTERRTTSAAPGSADDAEANGRGADLVGSRRGSINWRRNLYALLLAQLLAIVGFSLRVPFLPFYLGDLGVETTEGQALWAGAINAGGAGVMAISAPVWGGLADRYGRKPMLLRATFAAMVTIGLMSLATEAWHLLALRFIEGSLTGTVTAATALVAASTPKQRLGYSLGLIQTSVFSGAALGPLFGGVLADQIGFRGTFLVASGMLASAGLIVLFLVKEQFTPVARQRGDGRSGVRSTFTLLIGQAMLTMVLVMLVVRFAAMATQPILPLYIEQLAPPPEVAVAGSSSLAGLTLGVLGLTSAISSVVLGRLGDRIGHRRILLWCALGAGLLYLPMAAAQQPWHLIVLQALFGIAAGGLIPSANALVAHVTAPERRGAVYGLMAGAGSLGGFIGPLAGAGIAATLGFRATFIATAFVLLLMAAAVVRVGESRGRRF